MLALSEGRRRRLNHILVCAGNTDGSENTASAGKKKHSISCDALCSQAPVFAPRVAVLVQAMVPSEASGVAFSVHPVTQASDQMIIEAGLGLGEAVVSGEITPDTYIVSKPQGEIVEQHIAAQTKRLVRSQGGSSVWEALEPANDQPKLSVEQIKELAATIVKIEQYFGFPVDVEWAYAGGKLYILQSRPITTIL